MAEHKADFLGVDSIREEKGNIEYLSESYEKLVGETVVLNDETDDAEEIKDGLEKAKRYHFEILNLMNEIRELADDCEAYIPKGKLPYPSYSDILYYI